ncbi:MAG: hypothetical protein IJA47_01815 [Oscillospiraceae bacterium]|nr:hypothetical protein [Oscillospiraceae bacterium]
MKNSLFKKLISLLICLTMVLAYLPAGLLIQADAANSSSGILSDKTVADPYTLHAWKDTAFDPYNLTTEHAGGVWTDKSVLEKGDIAAALPGVSGLTVADNNFLVALSALGANSVVAGQGSTPTDTIFVLDLSNSMENADLREMVNATNDSIHSLLTANPDNRVGVAVYSTSTGILLPLDRYTPVQKGSGSNRTNAYIEMSDSYGEIRTARTGYFYNTTYVQDSNGDDVTTSISASGATFIQGGLWQAYQMFDRASETDSRTPVLVLMSDGAPSYGSEDYNDVSSRDVGNGSTGSVTDGLAFLTQLTAAYVKEKIADKYNTSAYFYTVGLGVSESYGVSIAEAVLDTSQTRSDPEGWWNTYLGLANQQNQTMSFRAAGENVTIAYDDTITAASKNYTDRYFPADDASNLSSAFQGIVNEINLKASYNVTRIEGADANSGGYVTFVDEIGTGMQVKNIKGILVGDTLFTGQRLAQALLNQEFGTAENPTSLGDNMVWALKQRLGITETATVHDLIQHAYDAGQIAYNATTGEYSNLIGWFSDANGDYLGFWDYDDPNCAIPAGAAYANASYGMLGTTTDSQTAHASDMMYVAVMVSKEITQVGGQPVLEAKTPQLVTFRVPASLLPTVTYQIDVQAASGEEITEQTPATITYNEAEPIRLVYEVGVHSALTPENIQDFLREGYQAKDADGNYYLYTNAWYWDGADNQDWSNPDNHPDKGDAVLYDTAKNHISYAYFEPSAENEHYYFTEDTDLYINNGTSYQKLTSAPVTDGSVTYYTQHRTYVSKNAATQTGVTVDAEVDIHYGAVSQKLLADSNNYAVDNDGVYYIKEGTMHYHTIHEHDKLKEENNPTGSFKYRLHQLVDIAVDGQNRASHHFELAYLGNNGRITYSPAQGFTLRKVMAGNATATGDFIFDVTLSGDTDGLYTETVNGVSIQKVLANNAFTLYLEAGEQVTITGLDVGATYTITERERAGYTLGGIVAPNSTVNGATASGTVAENQLHNITYTNDVQQYGSLLVTKDVTYNKGTQPQAVNHSFRITVELTGLAGKQVYVNGVLTTLDQNGRTVLTLKDGEQALITGIPEGTAYTVTEELTEGTTNIPYGYTADSGYTVTAGSFNGAIAKDTVATAAVQNAYTPDDVVIDDTDPAITLQVNKELIVDLGSPAYLPDGYNFLFLLKRYDPAISDWKPLENKATIRISHPTDPSHPDYDANNDNKGTAAIDLSGIPFDSVGSHYFRITEDIPANLKTGWTYDRTHHDFKVIVTDTDLDGKLEISSVEKVDETVTITPTDIDNDTVTDVWAVRAGFTNSYVTQSTKLTIAAKKTLTGATLKDGQFDFVLYKTGADFVIPANPTAFPAKNGANGDIVFTSETYPFTTSATNYYYVMKETSTSGNGFVVDDTIYEIRVTVSPNSNNAAITEIAWRENGETNYNQLTTVPENNIFNSISFENSYTAAPDTLELSGNKTLTNLTPGVQNPDMTAHIVAGEFKFNLTKVSGPDSNDTIKIKTSLDTVKNYSDITSAVRPGGDVVFTTTEGGEECELYFDSVGTYVFKLVEAAGSQSHITYDDSEYLVTVVVTDNGLGQLKATATYSKDGVPVNAIVFNNTYTASPVTDLKIHANKVLNVGSFQRPLNANDFHVTLTHPDGTTETVYNDANGIFAFAPLSFDSVGVYDYSISELIPHGAVNNKYNGITYDAIAKTFTIRVEDGGNGQLVAKLDGQTQPLSSVSRPVATIINTYEADPVTIHLLAHKDLVGRDLNENEFSFRIEPIAGAPSPANGVVKNDAEGNVDFGNITYPAIGTYQYEVTEQKLDENGDPITPDPVTGEYVYKGVTYSKKVYTVTVTVTDNGFGKLTAQIASVDEDTLAQPGGIVFTNIYKATSVTVQVEGNSAATNGKIFTDESSLPENKKDLDDYAFRFVLTTLGGNIIQTVSDNGAGFSFDALTFDTTGVYQYLIHEWVDNFPGVSYDRSVYRVTVTVTDNGLGQLQAAVTYEKASSGENDDYTAVEGIVFQNSYKAKETAVTFTGTKTLTGGRKLKANDFTFILKDAQTGAEIATAKNDADGNFAFETVTYNSEGTYTYTLEEKKEGAAGITYDATNYTITVTVTDVNGQLQAVTAVTKGTETVQEAGFTNIFTPEAAVVTVNVNKELVNNSSKDFSLEGFQFLLEREGWKQTFTSDANGKAALPLTFTAEDVGKTYTYKLSEVVGDVAHMTYDKTVYEIVVRVTQSEDGQLQVAVEREGTDAFKFVNTYYNVSENPKTGDGTNLWLTMSLMLSSVACLFVLLLSRKHFAD